MLSAACGENDYARGRATNVGRAAALDPRPSDHGFGGQSAWLLQIRGESIGFSADLFRYQPPF